MRVRSTWSVLIIAISLVGAGRVDAASDPATSPGVPAATATMPAATSPVSSSAPSAQGQGAPVALVPPAAPATSPSTASVPADIVAAREFRLVDETGRATALLRNDDHGLPSLRMMDSDGHPRLLVRIGDGQQPEIALLDSGGQEVASLGVGGTGDNPGLYVYDRQGVSRCYVGLSGEKGVAQTPVVAVFKDDGQPALSMEVDDGLSNLSVFSKGVPAVRAYAKPNGDHGIGIYDSDMRSRLALALAGRDGAATMRVTSPNAKQGVILSAIGADAQISFTDRTGKVRIQIETDSSGAPRLFVIDNAGKRPVNLGAAQPEPAPSKKK